MNSGTTAPSPGSIPDKFGPLCKLQWWHARARLARLGYSAVLTGHNMLNMETEKRVCILPHAAVFATLDGTFPNEAAKCGVHAS